MIKRLNWLVIPPREKLPLVESMGESHPHCLKIVRSNSEVGTSTGNIERRERRILESLKEITSRDMLRIERKGTK